MERRGGSGDRSAAAQRRSERRAGARAGGGGGGARRWAAHARTKRAAGGGGAAEIAAARVRGKRGAGRASRHLRPRGATRTRWRAARQPLTDGCVRALDGVGGVGELSLARRDRCSGALLSSLRKRRSLARSPSLLRARFSPARTGCAGLLRCVRRSRAARAAVGVYSGDSTLPSLALSSSFALALGASQQPIWACAAREIMACFAALGVAAASERAGRAPCCGALAVAAGGRRPLARRLVRAGLWSSLCSRAGPPCRSGRRGAGRPKVVWVYTTKPQPP